MATKEQLKQEDQQYAQAFNEPDQKQPEQSEDEAFGITPDVSADDGQGDGTPEATTIQGGDQSGDQSGDPQEAGESPAEEASETPAQEAAEQGGEPEKSQQEKSWEGRLKAREAELKAREDALNAKSKGEPAEGSPEEEAGETPAEEAHEDAAGDSDMSAEEAIKKLGEDFGPEFVNMIVAIATAKAKEAAGSVADDKVGAVGQNVDAIISHLNDQGAKQHFRDIKAAHPDFMDVSQSPAFLAWIDAKPEDQKADDQRIIKSGNSDEINSLLSAFKASKDQGKTKDDSAADAAEGVRSGAGGIHLPDHPAASDDYAKAWEQA